MLYIPGKLLMSTFRFTNNNITLFLKKKTKFQDTSFMYIVKDFLLHAMNAIFPISIFSLYITWNQHISGSTVDILIILALLENWFQAQKYG